MTRSEPRPVTPLDLPLMRRVIPHSLPLDMSAALTHGINGLEDALLSSVPLADLGAPTLVLRKDDEGYVGQFRFRALDTVAHLTLLAPEPDEANDRDWVELLEAIAFEAGKRGAHLLTAEVGENHAAFVSLRRAGFAVYSRQVILRRWPHALPGSLPDIVRPVAERDAIGISTLHANTVPRLLQQAESCPNTDRGGWVYEQDGEIAGYLAITEGKSGIVIRPYFHPEVYNQASVIVLSALKQIARAGSVPVYLYARAYQDWLRGVLEQVEFEPWAHQALMVKYTVVRAERLELAALPGLESTGLHSPRVVEGPVPYHKSARQKGRLLPLWRRNGSVISTPNGNYETSNHG